MTDTFDSVWCNEKKTLCKNYKSNEINSIEKFKALRKHIVYHSIAAPFTHIYPIDKNTFFSRELWKPTFSNENESPQRISSAWNLVCNFAIRLKNIQQQREKFKV